MTTPPSTRGVTSVRTSFLLSLPPSDQTLSEADSFYCDIHLLKNLEPLRFTSFSKHWEKYAIWFMTEFGLQNNFERSNLLDSALCVMTPTIALTLGWRNMKPWRFTRKWSELLESVADMVLSSHQANNKSWTLSNLSPQLMIHLVPASQRITQHTRWRELSLLASLRNTHSELTPRSPISRSGLTPRSPIPGYNIIKTTVIPRILISISIPTTAHMHSSIMRLHFVHNPRNKYARNSRIIGVSRSAH